VTDGNGTTLAPTTTAAATATTAGQASEATSKAGDIVPSIAALVLALRICLV